MFVGPPRKRGEAYRERHSRANRRRQAAARGIQRRVRPGHGRSRDKSESDESDGSLWLVRTGLKTEFDKIRMDHSSVMSYVDSKKFSNIVFERASGDICASGIECPCAKPCPDSALIDAVRQMSLERWSSLHLDSQIALALASCGPNHLCTVLPSFEGRLRHLQKYDRSDELPDEEVLRFFSRIFFHFPRGAPDVEYFEAINETSHVDAFRQRWSHVLNKSSGIDGEKLCGQAASKAVFLDTPGSEALLSIAMASAKDGTFYPELMRAAGRAKVMTQESFIEITRSWLNERYINHSRFFSDSDDEFEETVDDFVPQGAQSEVKTMDRLIWISPPTSLHVSTPGARTLSRGVKEAQISTYGVSPFRGGAMKLFRSFGYLGAYHPTNMQVALSNIKKHERTKYYRALERDRDYHVSHLFGMGSDVRRMDSSMRRWWIEIWGRDAYRDFPMSEREKRNLSKALIDAHCGGQLALDGRLIATVKEGATTGAVGVSTLESTYRWISDLLGVTFNLQKEIVNQLRRSFRKGQKVDELTADLAGRTHGLSWLRAKRVDYHPSNLIGRLGDEEVQRRFNLHSLNLRCSDPKYALLPRLGPGTDLFEELLPIVAFYYCTVANGDDDWNTFPLLEYVRLDELPSILDPSVRSRWLASTPKLRETPMKIISNKKMEEAFAMLKLPTKLNSEKGTEGRGLESFLLNSMHPIWSDYDKSYTFFIESSRLKTGLQGLTHPDDVIRTPAHTVLRMVGLVFNHPDPRVYEIYKSLVYELAEMHGLWTHDGFLNVNKHLDKEKTNSLYNLVGPGSAGSPFATELREGRVRFPEYSEVLEHHNLYKSAEFVRNNEYTVQLLLDLGFPQERW